MKVLMYNSDVDEDSEDWTDIHPEPVPVQDRETGEWYIINPAGTKIYLD